MKNIFSVFVIMFLSLSAYAQDEQSVKVCKDLAQSQALAAAEARQYIDQCVKDIAEVEDEIRKKAKS